MPTSPPSMPRRAAAIEVKHWHARYDAAFLPNLRRLGLEIVGCSDSDIASAQSHAAQFGGEAFSDYREMIAKTKPDVVVALGRHVDMPEIFRFLVDEGVPFIMEKPWGIDAPTVNALVDHAEAKGAWALAPFPMRHSPWAQTVRRMLAAGELGDISHLVLRLVRPAPWRYPQWLCDWMLDPAQAGGGCLRNLGPHGIDLARYITGEQPEVLSANISDRAWKAGVEDFASSTMRTPSGILIRHEVGYLMPTWPGNSTDMEQKIAARHAVVTVVPGGVQIFTVKGSKMIPSQPRIEEGYPKLIREGLEALGRGDPPPVPPSDLARVVELIDDTYRLAAASA